jgi:hypothetical protein
MLIKKRVFGYTLCVVLLTCLASGSWAGKKSFNIDETSSLTLDTNEQTHLIFMREEEKLARDVYIMLSTLYPDSPVFGNIDDSEQRHTDAVKDKLHQYNIEDPNTNDNVGVFTGEDYGWYFTEKYQELLARGALSEFDALYVGAFIEELDMLDINQCPKVIVETHPDIDDVSECGKVYTDNADIQRLYENLLEGSESHLAAYVRMIEAVLGEGSYQAQVLTQEQVDSILAR